MSNKKGYAIVGTGARAGMFFNAITQTYRNTAELVAFCDLSQVRMDYYNHLTSLDGFSPLPTYKPDQFDRMIAETHPDTIIVTTIDGSHHTFITRAMVVTARYKNGEILSYCLIAYSPWEGLRVAITGTKGRIEMDIEESITHLLGDGEVTATASASKGPVKQARMRVFPMFGQPYEVDVPAGDGGPGHVGADILPHPPADPYYRAASHIDGAASVLVGIATNQAMASGQMVCIDELFPLSSMMPVHT